jgi:cell division protein FtsQ
MSRRATLALARTPSVRPALSFPTGALGRALAIGALLFAVLGLAYAGARQTSVFGLETIKVKGASREVKRDVRAALAPLEGTSLVALDPGEVERTLAAVPVVKSAHVDRAFPHTLTIEVEPERPVAVYRSGSEAWLVAESGRVLATLKPTERPTLPRIRTTVERDPTVGASLVGDEARTALAVLAAVPRRLPGKVLYAQLDETGVTLVLAETNQEIRLGEPRDVEQKLAAAVAVLRALPPEELALVGYVDVSLPGRAVTGPFSQPSSESLDSD